MKKKDLLITIIFISFLVLPSILYLIFKNKMDNTNYENRELYKKPEISLKNIVNFPKEFENYYNDNLPFKNEIRRLRSNILYNVFNIGNSSNVIIGQDGWMFYNSDSIGDGNTIASYRNIGFYTKTEKEEIENELIKNSNKLKEKGIELIYFLIPNKENVYSEKLNGIILKSQNKLSKLEDLINYLSGNNELNIVYPKEELIKNKTNNETYYKYDTHWNNYGAYVGTMELMKYIDDSFEIPNIIVEYSNYSGDLAKMNLMPSIKNSEPIVNNFYDEIETICNDIGKYKVCESNKPIYNKTILFIGDSFREATVQYISKIYKKSIFLHRGDYQNSMIERYKPNIVIYELIERYQEGLKKINI